MLLFWPFTEAGRFLIPLIPCLLIGAVEGLAGIASWLGRMIATRLRPSRLRFQAASLVLALSLPYSVYMVVTGRTHALEETHREFDAACDWINAHADGPGPVLSRHPGEVFWRTGRQGLEVASLERPGDGDADSDAIARTIDRYHVAYLLIDQERYALAPHSPLAQFVAQRPERARKVWDRQTEHRSVTVYRVRSGRRAH
jgi:hypothetical protein